MHPKDLVDSCSALVAQVVKFDHPAEAVVSRYFREQRKAQGLGPRERTALSEAVFSVLRHKLLFDHFSPSGSGAKERRMAILGLAYLRDPFHPKGIDAKSREFLNGGLNATEKTWLQQCDLVDRSGLLDRHHHNLPEWLVSAIKPQLGDAFAAYVESLKRPSNLDVRVNVLHHKVADVQAQLTTKSLACLPTPYSPWGLRFPAKSALTATPAYASGAIEIQDEGSQLLAVLVDAKRGEMVADFCAGAGGKTLALGAAMRNTGRLYAFDNSAHRLDALKPRLARSGLSNVHPAVIAHERDDRLKRLAGKMDRVLVDAPCSGLGTLRRSPDLKWRQSSAGVAAQVAQQNAILDAAARLLKPGGRLVYATCSLLVEENENVAQAFGLRHPRFKPLPAEEVLTQLKVSDANKLCAQDGMYLRLWPHVHGTDGFFAAVWTAP